MCGIVGALHTGASAPVDGDRLARMRDTMVHRGPDGAGLWRSRDGRVGLAHRRLAIVDLSEAAAQPMATGDGSVVVTFNGEIYNHLELRRELESLGHRFRTDHSDTEVILHAYRAWGLECVHRFRGMFAFGLWDDREQRLWLVRDRIGVKPLYWTRVGERVLFASEIKALLADPDVPRRVDPVALYHYLTFLTAPAPATLFDGIHKLPGGCWVTVDANGTLRQERWWDVWDEVEAADSVAGRSDDELAEGLLDELREAVRLRKMSDVPVGVFLSGGIDSTTNAVLFSEDAAEPVKTFAIGYEQDYASYTNEFDFARMVAERLGADHHERRLSMADVVDIMPLVVRHQDEPLGDPVCVPVYYVSKLARDSGVIVCQVGEGSDELFMGYPEWRRKLRLQRMSDWPVPRSLRRLGHRAARATNLELSMPVEWLRRSAEGTPVFWSGAESLTERAKRLLVGDDVKRAVGGATSFEAVRPIRERFLERAPRPRDHLDWMAYVDLNFRLPELLLMRVDKMSMATSVECRVPFLDHRFVGRALSIPAGVRARDDRLKYLLKRAVRGVIPDAIIDRPKQGFGVPVHDWLQQDMGPALRSEIDHFADRTGLLDPQGVAAYHAGPPDPGTWTLYNLAVWWRSNFD